MTTATSEPAAGILKWLRGAVVGGLLHLRVLADPKPASRPKVNRKTGSVYFSAGHEEFYRECQKQIAEARGQSDGQEGPLQGPLAVAIDVACQRPRTSKLAYPRGDVDNFAKLPLDAVTKSGIWGDDGQVVALACQKRWARPEEEAGVSVWVGRMAVA